MTARLKQEKSTLIELPLQAASQDIWAGKYQLKDRDGVAMEQTPEDSYRRVAKALAEIEETPEKQAYWFKEFLWALQHGALPAGRILANAGAAGYKPVTSTINCTVSGTIHDSMDDILQKLHEAGITLKRGCGIGYEFSTLRPRGAVVTGAGARTSGPLSFMDIYDSMCMTISSAGGRRGAQMATFDIGHPDVLEFIQAKREDGRLRQFNLSVLLTDAFMQSLEEGALWPLFFPITQAELEHEKLNLSDPAQVLWRHWPTSNGYFSNERGQVACKVYGTIPAKELWETIIASTYDYAEPGFILIDRVNEMNNNWFCEEIRASNPCGEQPLPPYGACLLGSINLVRFIQEPFTEKASFNWEQFRKVVRIFTRLLDNVVEIHGLPLPQQQQEIMRKRRHGMGFLGLGSALTMLCMAYGDKRSLAFTRQLGQVLALTGWEAGLELAREKGAAPIMEEEFIVTESMLAQRPEMRQDGYQAGDSVKGRVLHARYSRYMQRIAAEAPELVDAIATEGARFTHHSSIAPTGTIALSLANNVSNGIEPTFAHHYCRNVVRPNKKTKASLDVYSYELLAYRALIDPEAMPGDEHGLPAYFMTTSDVTPAQHIEIQAAAQEWIDSSISKTVNVPAEITFADFQDIYKLAYQRGLKGCTTFRYNPEVFQGVLVKKEDLKNTLYYFTLEDGQVIAVRGNEEIEYEGEIHTAANLFEALKEGYYDKY